MEVSLYDNLYPLDRFYFSANFTGKYHVEIKTTLYVEGEDKGSLVTSNSINAVLKFHSNDECYPALSNLRKMFWQASKMTNDLFATILDKNKLLKEESSGYLIECLIASSSKLNGDLIKNLSENESRKCVDKETQRYARGGWLLLDKLTARNRRFRNRRFVLETNFNKKNGRTITSYEFKSNSKCGVFMGVSDNPSEFNKSLRFKVINTTLKLN